MYVSKLITYNIMYLLDENICVKTFRPSLPGTFYVGASLLAPQLQFGLRHSWVTTYREKPARTTAPPWTKSIQRNLRRTPPSRRLGRRTVRSMAGLSFSYLQVFPHESRHGHRHGCYWLPAPVSDSWTTS